MRELLELYSDKITGAISGWDRIRFRGTIRWLSSMHGVGSYIATHGILLKDFGNWANAITKKVRAACALRAESLGIPMFYLPSSKINKEARAREIAKERGVTTGDICMFSVVEPCCAPIGRRSSKSCSSVTARWSATSLANPLSNTTGLLTRLNGLPTSTFALLLSWTGYFPRCCALDWSILRALQ